MLPKGEQWNEIAGVGGGDLSATSYAVLLSAIARSGKSGSLRLERKPVTKEVFFQDGSPVGCRSNLAHETFGRFLLSAGVLSAEDHRSALSESLKKEVPLGEMLIERGLLTPQEVYKHLQKNLARKLLDAFTWDRGSFELLDQASIEDATIKINAPQLVLTGVLKLTPPAEVEAGVGRLREVKLALESRPPFQKSSIRIAGRAERVVQALETQPLRLEELGSIVSLPAEEVDRAAYALALIGVVAPASEIASRKLAASAARDSSAAGPRPTAAQSDEARDQALLLRQTKIVESYLSFRRKDSFDFLGLDETCTPYEIERSYLQAAETYAPWSLQAMGVTDFAEQGELLFLRAAQAYSEIRNSETRGALIHRRKVLRTEEANRKKAKFAIKTDLLDSEEQFKKGLVFAEQGDLVGALKLLEFAVDCDPQRALYRAELAYRKHQFEPSRNRRQALAELREATRIEPTCGPAHYYLGLVLESSGDLEAAESALRRSIKLMAPDRRPIDALRELSAKKKR